MAEKSHNPQVAKSFAGNRLAKVIARHGLCSRRQAESWITAGRVIVNGKIMRTPAFNVTEGDTIVVDGQPLAEKRGTRVWLYHKPAGLVVTESDPEGRKTIFEDLAQRGLPRVLTVGRLDINTEGLLLLTNDGGLKRTLELPATGWLRRYRVRAHGRIEQTELDKLKKGITVEGIKYGPIDAKLERVQGSNVWLIVALSEGKNREIKKVLSSLGLEVNRLIRTSFGPFQLGDIPVGGLDTVKARVLQDQLGRKLAKLAGVDFDSEMPDPVAPAQTGNRSPKGRTGDTRIKSHKAENKTERPARAMGRGGPRKGAAADADEGPILKKVHFGGDRGTEMFEPKAKRKTDDSRGGSGGGGRGKPGGPRGGADRGGGGRGKPGGPRGGADRGGGDRGKSGGRPRSDRSR